jgi:hypothetical protein
MPMITSSVISFGSAHSSDREKLLSTIAQEPHYVQILQVAGGWWVAWQDHYSRLKDVKTPQSLQDFVKVGLADERPVKVACALCCIAMSFQHLRQGIDDGDLHLSATAKCCAQQTGVHRMIGSNCLTNYETKETSNYL